MAKKTIWSFGITATALTFMSLPLVVSCASSGKKGVGQYVSSDIGDLQGQFNPGEAQNSKLIAEVARIRTSTDETAKTLLNQKTILITTGGKKNDKSFNQSVWEAISKFSREVGQAENAFYETSVISNSAQFNAYEYALSKGYKFWFLTGFQQEGQLASWLQIGNNIERFKANKTVVITVDWYPGDAPAAPNVLSQVRGHILGLNFKTQEGGFVAAYSAAQLLSEIHAEDPNQFPSGATYLNSFGGGDFSGVTNFNYGFYEGLRQFNEDMIAGTIFPNQAKYLVRATAPVELSTGFAINNESKAKAERQVDNQNPQVIFPIAGSLTAVAIDRARDKGRNQWVIGVDTDQSLAFPNDKGLLLTSVEKRIAVATYKALLTVYGLTGYDASTSLLDNNHHLDADRFILGSDGQKINFNSVGGYDEGFVGVSKSTLDPQKFKFKTGTTYASRYDQITAATWASFFGNKKVQPNALGRFEISVTDSKQHGLLPSDEVIQAFAEQMAGWPQIVTHDKNGNELSPAEKEQKMLEHLKAIFALKNVKKGFMTFSNQANFFAPVVKLINEQS